MSIAGGTGKSLDVLDGFGERADPRREPDPSHFGGSVPAATPVDNLVGEADQPARRAEYCEVVAES